MIERALLYPAQARRPRLAWQPSGSAAPPWALALLALALGLGLGLLMLAPARWLDPLVSRTGHLHLREAQGTVWAGSARLLLSAGPGSREQAFLPGRIQWKLGLQGLALRIDLQALCCMNEPMRWRLGIEEGRPQLDLAPHQSLWPAEPLAALGTPLNTLQFAGRLQLRTEALQWRWGDAGAQMRGGASLELLDLASALSTLKPMGHYRIDLQGGATTQLSLQTVRGALQLQGQGQWRDGRLQFSGQASAQPPYEAALSNILNIIGRRVGAQSIINIG